MRKTLTALVAAVMLLVGTAGAAEASVHRRPRPRSQPATATWVGCNLQTRVCQPVTITYKPSRGFSGSRGTLG